MMTRRKQGKWITLDGNHVRSNALAWDDLSTGDWTNLAIAYTSLKVPSDNFAFSDQLLRQLSLAFQNVSGKLVDGRLLTALIMMLRKRGLWPRLGRGDSDLGFNDIDELHGA